jgi:hypothetical protein
LAAANALLDNLQAGKPGSTANLLQQSIDELQEMGYVCDESGCVLVLPGDKDNAAGMFKVTTIPFHKLSAQQIERLAH